MSGSRSSTEDNIMANTVFGVREAAEYVSECLGYEYTERALRYHIYTSKWFDLNAGGLERIGEGRATRIVLRKRQLDKFVKALQSREISPGPKN